MTKMIKILTIVSILFTSSSLLAIEKSPSSLNQVRNSLWVFGVDNGLSSMPAGVENILLEEEERHQSEQSITVPEELQMAILKIDA